MPKKKCPECNSENVISIHYGFIDDPDAIERIKNGEVATGGCCIVLRLSKVAVP
jgi:hypothetical protein